MAEPTEPAGAQERYRISPRAFAIPDDRYLGSAAVVGHLVSAYCAKVESVIAAVGAGHPVEDGTAEINEEINALAAIFNGQNPEYEIVKGYHDVSLQGKLVADLGTFWRKQHAQWGDDAVAVLFDWLAAILMEKVREAKGDDMLLGVMLKPSLQYTIGVLVGSEPRAAS